MRNGGAGGLREPFRTGQGRLLRLKYGGGKKSH